MPFRSSMLYGFDDYSIDEAAPESCGVYHLTRKDGLSIYIGSTGNLRRRLHEHQGESDERLAACLAEHDTTLFTFELSQTIAEAERREAILIEELQPACNVLLK